MVSKNGYGDMVIMSVEMYESTMKRLSMYRELELSESQIESIRKFNFYKMIHKFSKADIPDACVNK